MAAVAAALLVATGRAKRRGTQREAAVARGLRRGAMVGSAFGLLAVLRLLDGLTPLTASFVVAPFVLAEVVLSARRP